MTRRVLLAAAARRCIAAARRPRRRRRRASSRRAAHVPGSRRTSWRCRRRRADRVAGQGDRERCAGAPAAGSSRAGPAKEQRVRRSCSRSTPRAACRASRSPTRWPPLVRSSRQRNPHQQLAIVTFNGAVHVAPAVHDRPVARSPLRSARCRRSRYGTTIYDGLDQSLDADRRGASSPRRRSCCSRTAPTSAASRSRPPCSSRLARSTRPRVLGRARLERVRPDDARRRRRRERRSFVRADQAVRADGDLRRARRAARERVPPALPVGRAGRRSAVAVQGGRSRASPATRLAYVAPRLVVQRPPAVPLSSVDRIIQSSLVDGARRSRDRAARSASRSRTSPGAARAARPACRRFRHAPASGP